MGTGLFGRTNRAFPPVWLSLATPASGEDLASLVKAAIEANTVIDVGAHPGLFGGFMRGHDGLMMTSGGGDIAHSPDEDGAANLIHAHLIETLCALGREWLDFYFLRLRCPLEEFQITGALRALEWARDEGHVRFVGLSAEADPVVVVSSWQFHDAFEALLLPSPASDSPRLIGLAEERRAGVVVRCAGSEEAAPQTALVTVRSADGIWAVIEAGVPALVAP